MLNMEMVVEMSQQEIADQLKKSILSVLNLDVSIETISGNTNLYELGLDSLNVVALLTDIENLFDITIDVEDLSAEMFEKFSNILAFVVRRTNERS